MNMCLEQKYVYGRNEYHAGQNEYYRYPSYTHSIQSLVFISNILEIFWKSVPVS